MVLCGTCNGVLPRKPSCLLPLILPPFSKNRSSDPNRGCSRKKGAMIHEDNFSRNQYSIQNARKSSGENEIFNRNIIFVLYVEKAPPPLCKMTAVAILLSLVLHRTAILLTKFVLANDAYYAVFPQLVTQVSVFPFDVRV